MNWDMVGAIGEVLGAAGVIVTLAYLAGQVRASNRAVRSATMQELLDETLHLMGQLTQDTAFAGIWVRGSADFDGLAADEQVQLRSFYYQMVLIWERFHHLEREAGVDEWIIHHNRKVRRDVVGSAGFQAWFQRRKRWIGDDFRKVLEQDIAQSDGYEAHTPSNGGLGE